MDHLCKNDQCQGIENYCTDSSHPLVYFCDCKKARSIHNGHAVKMVDLEFFSDCISRIQKESIQRKQEFTLKADERIRRILETLSEYNSELEEVIQKCTKAKEALASPETRLEALEKYIDPYSPEEQLRKVLGSKVDKKEFYMKIQRKMGSLCREIEQPIISEEFQEFLRYPKSFTSLKADKRIKFELSRLPYSNITQLNLGGNEIGDEGAKALAIALPSSQITQLNLRTNQIGNEGAKSLASVLASSKITQLYLGGNPLVACNRIGDEGAKALAIALPSSQVTQLDLGFNEIGDEGAKSLASVLASSQVTQLNLTKNQIGNEGRRALQEAKSNFPNIIISF